MLVEFSVRNFLSFKEKATLNMRRNQAYKENPQNVIDSSSNHLLKIASIYGANASGKTNLLIALYRFIKIIHESMNASDSNGESVISQNYMPFDFESEYSSSEFEVILENNGFEYTYGFEYDETQIIAEWVYRKNLSTNRSSMLLYRQSGVIEFGSSVKKRCGIYHDQIPDEVLVLTFFNKIKMPTIFRQLYSYLKQLLFISPELLSNYGFIEDVLPSIINNEKDTFVSFLNAIDVGITDINIVEERNELAFYTTHIGKDNEQYTLNLFNESDGTIKCIFLYIHFYYALINNSILIIDELNEKLHPLLLKYIISLLYNADSQAQLIFTTHALSLLGKDCFRRDQIWFVEKDQFGYSSLKALASLNPRSDLAIYKNYIDGKFGGVPSFSDFSFV